LPTKLVKEYICLNDPKMVLHTIYTGSWYMPKYHFCYQNVIDLF
jgi:hypothetical protein